MTPQKQAKSPIAIHC